MDYKWIGVFFVGVFLASCSIKEESLGEPIEESLSSASSQIEVPISSAISSSLVLSELSSSWQASSSSIERIMSSSLDVSSSSILTEMSSSSMISSSSVWVPPPPIIEEDTSLGVSGDSVRALLRLAKTPPTHVQTLMHLWDSLAPDYIDTLLSSSLDSTWMLPEDFDENWCTFEGTAYDVYTYSEETFSRQPPYFTPMLIYWAKVYAGEKLVYSSEYLTPKGSLITTSNFSCYSFGLFVEPIGCSQEGVHVAFPDGSHLQAVPRRGFYESFPPYAWTPNGPWYDNNIYQRCPT